MFHKPRQVMARPSFLAPAAKLPPNFSAVPFRFRHSSENVRYIEGWCGLGEKGNRMEKSPRHRCAEPIVLKMGCDSKMGCAARGRRATCLVRPQRAR